MNMADGPDRCTFFSLDSLPERSWQALTFGNSWNGWVTPVVTHTVLSEVLVASGEPHRWEGVTVWLGTPLIDLQAGQDPAFWDRVEPSDDGTYDLAQLGWTLIRAESDLPALPRGMASAVPVEVN